MAYENNNLGAEIGWDDEISQESNYSLLDPGEYDFTVTKDIRGRFNGSTKMCPCTQHELSLLIEGITITDTLFMNTKVEWKLSQFFISIGQKKPGVALRPNWNTVPGSRGRCKIGIREWTGRDGETHKSNEVKAYLPPDPNASPAPVSYQQSRPSSPQHPQGQYQQGTQYPQGTQQTMAGYPTGNPGHWQAGKF